MPLQDILIPRLLLALTFAFQSPDLQAQSTNTSSYQISEPALKQIGKAYGFAWSQKKMVELISEQHPDLALSLKSYQMIFTMKFSNPEARAETLLRNELGSSFDPWRDKHFKTPIKELLSGPILLDQAENFHALLAQRSEGILPEDVQATFLWLKYAPRPEAEITDGWTRDYSSSGDPKALGLDVTLKMPMSWSSAPGRRPHILRSWTDQNGSGLGFINLQVRDISDWQGVANEKVLEALVEAAPDMIPKRATLIDYQPMSLDTAPFVRIDYTAPVASGGIEITQINRTYFGYFEGRLLNLMCGQGFEVNDMRDHNDLRRGVNALCHQVATSLVIINRWE